MSIRGLAEVTSTPNYITFWTSDSGEYDLVLRFVRSLFPKVKVEEIKDQQTGYYQLNYSKLDGKDLYLGKQIVASLCARGWEPFQVGDWLASNCAVGTSRYYLRR